MSGLVDIEGAPTPREIEIAGLVARGLLNKEIAARLGISLCTVKAHEASFARKMGLAATRRVCVALAYLRLCDEDERAAIIGFGAPKTFEPRLVA